MVAQYDMDVSPELISSVTDAMTAEVGAWQGRPLEQMYPVVYFDALRAKILEDAVVRRPGDAHSRCCSCLPRSQPRALLLECQ